MAQTFTNNAGSGTQMAIGRDYAMQMAVGRVGELADISNSLVVTGNNETVGRIPYGVPLVRNGSGVLPNSAAVISAAGACLGLSLRSDANEAAHRQAAVPYGEGVEPLDAINILKAGAIFIQTYQTVTTANPLRYFRTGPNAGLWGTTVSAGNSLLLSAGNWEIERGVTGAGLMVLRINTPGALTFTLDD
jgi:hypothetical protein